MRKLAALTLTFFSLLVIFTGLSVLSASVPREAMADNVRSSAVSLHDEGDYPKIALGNFYIDNYSDAIMINQAYGIEGQDAFDKAIGSRYYTFPDSNPTAYLYQINVNGAEGVDDHYARYWHGYLVTLRPLMTLTDHSGIRVINYVMLLLLAAATLAMTWRRLPRIYFWGLLVTLLMFDIALVPLCMHFTSVFYIALGASLLLLLFPSLSRDATRSMCFFLTVGATTSYVDLLSAPILTWGIPVIISCAMTQSERKARDVVRLSLCWVAGYALMWVCKWILVAVFVSPDIFGDAISSVVYRSFAGDDPDVDYAMPILLERYRLHLILLAAAAVATVIAVLVLYLRKPSVKARLDRYGYLLLIAAGPVVWYAALFTHTLHHLFFTRRAAAVTVYATIVFIYYLCRRERNSRR